MLQRATLTRTPLSPSLTAESFHRKTPLVASKGFKPSRKPIPRKSAKQLLYEAQYELIRPKVLDRDNKRCRIKQKGCTVAANHVHHRQLRSQGGDNSLDNLCSTCLNCHHFIHDVDRKWAEREGWIIPAEGDKVDE